MSAIPKSPRIELPKLRKAARGADCRLNLPDVCNHDPETTILAHRSRAGMGIKENDYNALNMCSSCHDIYDRRRLSLYSNVELQALFDDAWPGQLEWWFREGHLK